MKKTAAFLAAAAIFALAGCSSNNQQTAATAAQNADTAKTEQTAAQTTAVQTAAAQTTAAAEEKGTGEAAGASGTLTVYTSQPEADIQALVAAYNEKVPGVTVEIFRSGTEEVISKVLAEKQAGSVLADVLLVSDAATFESLKNEDLLESYESPELSGIDSAYYDAEHTYTGTKVITTGIAVNTEIIKEIPAGLADLGKEIYKDELIMPSPLYSGAAAYNLGVITRTDGLGWEFYENIKANGVKVDKGNGAVQKAVIAGENGLGLLVDYMAVRAKNDGAPVAFVYPAEGSLSVTEPIGIIKGTAHETEAKSFVDFILSEEGQKATAEIGYTPIRKGVAAPEGLKSVDEITNLTYELSTLVETRDSDKEAFSKLFE